MGSPKTPQVPDPAKTYEQGVQTNIKYAPVLEAEEQKLRDTYDPQDVQHSLGLQSQYGSQALSMYQQNLNQVDPQGQAIRAQLGNAVSSDLSNGANLGAGLTREYQQGIRAAEAARGNTMGNSAVSAEALNQGTAAQALYQQRLQNAGAFVAQDNSIQQLTGIAGLTTAATTPDRTDSYVNPNAGTQGQNTALQYYQSALAGGAAGGGNPWTSALASAGGQIAGKYATLQNAQNAYSYLSGAGSAVADAVPTYAQVASSAGSDIDWSGAATAAGDLG